MTGVFDFHVRLGQQADAADRLLSIMDDCGIDRAAVSAGGVVDLDRLSAQIVDGRHVEADADNDAVLAGCQRAPDRLVPFYFANPHRDPGHYRSQAGLFRGLELSPAVHGVPLTDPRTTALVEVAAEFGHPVYLVCVGRPGAGVHELITLAAKFPRVPFVFGHCGFFGIDVHGINRIAGSPNIVAETSGCFTVVARLALERLGADRVLFGTEYPLQHPSVEFAKFESLGLDPETWQKVAWRNAHRLLGEETR